MARDPGTLAPGPAPGTEATVGCPGYRDPGAPGGIDRRDRASPPGREDPRTPAENAPGGTRPLDPGPRPRDRRRGQDEPGSRPTGSRSLAHLATGTAVDPGRHPTASARGRVGVGTIGARGPTHEARPDRGLGASDLPLDPYGPPSGHQVSAPPECPPLGAVRPPCPGLIRPRKSASPPPDRGPFLDRQPNRIDAAPGGARALS